MPKKQITIHIHDAKGNTKEIVVDVYPCPHCGNELHQTDTDFNRALLSCLVCDYAIWKNKDGSETELDF
jgi:transcription elongation factor Elf1